jgi:hypothetical protein
LLSGALAIIGDGAVSSAGFDVGIAADASAGADTDLDVSVSWDFVCAIDVLTNVESIAMIRNVIWQIA